MKKFCFDLVLMGLNHGIMMGIAGAVLLLLYPLLKKLMPPQVRCYLWALFFSVLLVERNVRPLLPVTLEDLVSTRGDIMASYPPAFLPPEYRGRAVTTRPCPAGFWCGSSCTTGCSGCCSFCGWRGSPSL